MDADMLALDSLAVHAGREDLAELGVHALPLDLSSTNPLPDLDAAGRRTRRWRPGATPPPRAATSTPGCGTRPSPGSRPRWPRWSGRREAVAFSSGMAAMTAVILAAHAGRASAHVVAVRPLYGGTDHLLASGLLGVEVTYCDRRRDRRRRPRRTPAWSSWRPRPTRRSSWSTSAPSSRPRADVPVLVDNTFATPVLQHPARHGAALVLHSATKYLGGHGDWSAAWWPATREWPAALRRVRAVTGGLLHPLGAYLLHRGSRTLPLRVRAQQETARRPPPGCRPTPRWPGCSTRDPGVRPARPGRPPDARPGGDARVGAHRRLRRRGPGHQRCGCSPTRSRSGAWTRWSSTRPP